MASLEVEELPKKKIKKVSIFEREKNKFGNNTKPPLV